MSKDKSFFNLCNNKNQMQKVIQILLKENLLHIHKPKAQEKSLYMIESSLRGQGLAGRFCIYTIWMFLPQFKSSFVFWQVTYE